MLRTEVNELTEELASARNTAPDLGQPANRGQRGRRGQGHMQGRINNLNFMNQWLSEAGFKLEVQERRTRTELDSARACEVLLHDELRAQSQRLSSAEWAAGNACMQQRQEAAMVTEMAGALSRHHQLLQEAREERDAAQMERERHQRELTKESFQVAQLREWQKIAAESLRADYNSRAELREENTELRHRLLLDAEQREREAAANRGPALALAEAQRRWGELRVHGVRVDGGDRSDLPETRGGRDNGNHHDLLKAEITAEEEDMRQK